MTFQDNSSISIYRKSYFEKSSDRWMTSIFVEFHARTLVTRAYANCSEGAILRLSKAARPDQKQKLTFRAHYELIQP